MPPPAKFPGRPKDPKWQSCNIRCRHSEFDLHLLPTLCLNLMGGEMDIEKLSLDELHDLNRRVVRRIRYLNSLKTGRELEKFEIGDRVCFHPDGKHMEGVVVRVNRKTLGVRTDSGHEWRVHPGAATKVSSSTTPPFPTRIGEIEMPPAGFSEN